MDILTSNFMLLLVIAASSVVEDFSMCVLGHIFDGCIGTIAVKKVLFALLLRMDNCGNQYITYPTARILSTLNRWQWLCIYHVLVWIWRGR
jgi:hypothetical protein